MVPDRIKDAVPEGFREKRAAQFVGVGIHLFRRLVKDGRVVPRRLGRRGSTSELNRTEVPTATLAELADVYFEQYVLVENRHPGTKKHRLKWLKKHLGHILAQELSPFDVTVYISKRKRKGLSAASINKDLAVLKHLLSWATDQALLHRNPVPKLRKLHEERKPAIEDRHLPILENAIQETLAKLRPECEPVFRFLYETGCRREEALSLKHEQVFLEDQLVLRLIESGAKKKTFKGVA